MIAALRLGAAGGALNGIVVAYGRIVPLIATFCTAFIYSGISLTIRPQPGGAIPDDFANLLTGNWGIVPYSVVLLRGAVLVIWFSVFRMRLERLIVAFGDNPESAFASGIPVRRVGLAAYMLAGLFAAISGLFLAAENDVWRSEHRQRLHAELPRGIGSGRCGFVRWAWHGDRADSRQHSALGDSDALSAVGISAFWQDFIEGGILVLVLGLAGFQLLRAPSWIELLDRSQS